MTPVEASAKVRASLETEFLRRGGTPEQWARVCVDPRKFNVAWRRMLGLEHSLDPPPKELRYVDVVTGELIRFE